MSELSTALCAFLDSHTIGALATRSQSGRIHQSVVYYLREGERLLISTEAQRHKGRDVAATGWASLCVMGHDRPFPSATFTGTATILTDGIGSATAAIAQRMTGAEQPPEPQSDQALAEVGRVLIAVAVEHVGPVSYIENTQAV